VGNEDLFFAGTVLQGAIYRGDLNFRSGRKDNAARFAFIRESVGASCVDCHSGAHVHMRGKENALRERMSGFEPEREARLSDLLECSYKLKRVFPRRKENASGGAFR
jgi:hypothetical protein